MLISLFFYIYFSIGVRRVAILGTADTAGADAASAIQSLLFDVGIALAYQALFPPGSDVRPTHRFLLFGFYQLCSYSLPSIGHSLWAVIHQMCKLMIDRPVTLLH